MLDVSRCDHVTQYDLSVSICLSLTFGTLGIGVSFVFKGLGDFGGSVVLQQHPAMSPSGSVLLIPSVYLSVLSDPMMVLGFSFLFLMYLIKCPINQVTMANNPK